RVSPEPFLIAVGFVLMLPLMPPLLGQDRDPARTSTATGALFGFSMVTKITFLPWAAVAVLLGDWKQRMRFAIASLVTAFFFAIPILTKMPRVLRWIESLLIHSER